MSLELLFLPIFFIFTGLYVSALMYVYSKSFDGRIVHKKWYWLVYLGVYALLAVINFVEMPRPVVIVYHLTVIAAPTFLYKGRIQKKILLPIFIYAMGLMSEAITALIIGYVQQFGKESIFYPSNLYVITFFISHAVHLAFIALIPLILPMGGMVIPKSHWFAIMVTPVVSIFASFYYWGLGVSEGVVRGPNIAILLFFLFFNVYILFIFSKISRDYSDLVTADISERQYKHYVCSYDQLMQNYTNLSTWKHEIKHKMLAMKYLLQNNEIEKISKEINDSLGLFEDASFESSTFQSGNMIVDSIISYKAQEMREKGIPFKARLGVPHDLKLNPYDLYAVLGNALDNSIEACQKVESDKRFIECHAYLRHKQLYIEVKNSYAGIIELDENGLPISSKKCPDKHGQKHGIGLNIIRQIANTYNGFFHSSYDEHSFTVLVLLTLTGKSNIDKITTEEVTV